MKRLVMNGHILICLVLLCLERTHGCPFTLICSPQNLHLEPRGILPIRVGTLWQEKSSTATVVKNSTNFYVLSYRSTYKSFLDNGND